MQRRVNASAAVKNAGEIGCSKMIKSTVWRKEDQWNLITLTINYITQLLNSRYIVVGLALCVTLSLLELTFWIKSLLCLVVVRNQLFSFWNRTAGNFRP